MSSSKYKPTEREQADVDKAFVYHAPKDDQPDRYVELRALAKILAEFYIQNCPASRERSLALTRLEESVMWANASIARNE